MDAVRRSRRTVHTWVALSIASVLLLSVAGVASAEHQPEITARCTYEVPTLEPPGIIFDFAAADPTGTTSDGVVNEGVCLFSTPDSDPGEASSLGPVHFLIQGATVISGQYSIAQASIVDDVFGNAVGGGICADFNHDHICGSADDGEPSHSFCGTSPVVTVGQDTDGDGHADFGWGLVVGINEPYYQTLDCDPVDAPTGTTGGVFDPAGGVYVTVSG